MAGLKLFLLGPPRIELDEASIDIKRRKALAMLVYLAVTGQPHSRDALATLFYPDQSQSRARAYLRRDLAVLNTSLDSDWLDADRETAQLKPGFWSDVSHFRKLVAECQQHDHPTEQVCSACIPLLTEATALYADDFLAGFTLRDCPEFDDWQFFEAESLRQELALGLERLVEGLGAQEDYEAAIPHARRWVALDPLHEPAQRHLMQLYDWSGQSSAALRQYEEYAQLLDKELGVPPEEETATLYEAIKAKRMLGAYLKTEGQKSARAAVHQPPAVETAGRTAPAPAQAPTPPHNLPPQPTKFIGREEELADIRRLLVEESDCRLLTLVGPGGIGKTRLALEVAMRTLDAFPNGVYFIPLAPLETAEPIVSTVGEYIGFSFREEREPKQQLLDYLRQKQMLLVMDNFEHVLAGATLVAEILQVAPQIKILATSRERLNLSGEAIYPVGSMEIPTPDSLKDTLEFDAARLFLQQARYVKPDFEPQPEERAEIKQICRLTQGMPLALTLAAGWLETLSVKEIGAELSRSLDFLETEMQDVPKRQRSVRAAFDYSWGRLSAEEQQILARLSVFRSGFRLAAAQTVADAGLRELRSLAHKSLVTRSGTERYEIHELLRQYAAEKLDTLGQTDKIRAAHCHYYLEALHQWEPNLKGGQQAGAMAEIDTEFENIRTAWYWAVQNGTTPAISQALEGLYISFFIRGRNREGIDFFEAARDVVAPGSGEEPHPLWGRILVRLGQMRSHLLGAQGEINKEIEQGLAVAQAQQDESEIALGYLALGDYHAVAKHDISNALDYYQQARQHYQALDEPFHLARVLTWLGYCYGNMARLDLFIEYNREALALARETNNKMGLAHALINLGAGDICFGNYQSAEKYISESNHLCDELRLTSSSAISKSLLSLTNFLEGNLAQAHTWARSGLEMGRDTKFSMPIAYSLAMLSLCASINGDYLRGAQLGQESLATPSPPFGKLLGHWSLAISQCGLQQNDEAWQQAINVLEIAHRANFPGMATWPLPIVAVLLAQTGQNERALELLALASTHPHSPTGWQARWPILANLRAELKAELGSEAFEAGWSRGLAQDVETVVASLLEQSDTELKKPASATAASMVERFIQDKLIATGGMGQVYRGRDTKTGQPVAIKRLKPELVTHNPEAVQRFIREGEILRQLNHPNIVKVLATLEVDNQPVIVMEYVSGGSLGQMLEQQPQLPLEQVLNIGLELADALARAHHLGVIHRDIKPDNVLLAQDGTPRLTDFGVAYLVQQDTRLTKEGAILGTTVYMSPEAWRGEALDVRSDIWSFGAVLFEMLAGHPPFEAKNAVAIMRTILHDPLPNLLQFRADAPPALVELIEQMMVKERQQRIESMRQIAARLEEIQRGVSAQT